jgi:hypothetical protein
VVEANSNNRDRPWFRARVSIVNLRMSFSCQRGCPDNRSDCLVHIPVDVIPNKDRAGWKLGGIRNRDALALGRD